MTMLLNAIFFGCNICVTQCLKQLDENMKTTKRRRKKRKMKTVSTTTTFDKFLWTVTVLK